MTAPYSFDEFFASNQEETISPFLTPSSRAWGKNLPIKTALLSALLLALAYVFSFLSPTTSLLFLAATYFLVGTPALISSLKDLSRFDINIDVLMTLAALLSVAIGSGLEGALLLVLFELSAAIEGMVSKKTRSAVLRLNKLAPRHAFVVEGDHLVETSLRDITPGMLIFVKAGEVVPLDAVVTSGAAFVNLAHLTGETAPISKQTGDAVPAGSITIDGSLSLRVTKTSRDSTLSRIIQLVQDAESAKPHTEQFLDRFGKPYATTIIALFLLFALTLAPLLSIPYLGMTGGIYRALAFLIAASPCALILATPTAYLSALSACARRGVLPKGGIVLDAIHTCQTIALDKTGTLTTGELSCIREAQIAGPPFDPAVALAYAAALEKHSTHPIAKAFLAKAVAAASADNVRSLPGLGLEGTIDGIPVAIGHRTLIEQKTGTRLPPAHTVAAYLSIGSSIFLFEFEDALRESAEQTIAALKRQNLTTVMLTGDHPINAEPVAKATNIDAFYADLRPEDKLHKIHTLLAKAGLIMVGDGINDAPALARATVGISMGTIGSATAVDASDVILMHDDLTLLPWLINKARATRRILTQNITLALLVILCATTPALFGWVPLWLAVILHEGGTVLVGLNSLRLLKR